MANLTGGDSINSFLSSFPLLILLLSSFSSSALVRSGQLRSSLPNQRMRSTSLLCLIFLLSQYAIASSVSPPCYHPTTDEFHFDNNNMLTCKNGEKSMNAIKFNSTLYTSLKCSRLNGSDIWEKKEKKIVYEYDYDDEPEADDLITWTKVTDASPTLKFTCEEYCIATGDGIKVRGTEHRNKHAVEVSCVDSSLDLTYDGLRVSVDDANIAICIYRKWDGLHTRNDFGGLSSHFLPAETPVLFECKKACTLLSPGVMNTTSSMSRYDDSISTCLPTDSQSILKITVDSTPYDSLGCNNYEGWKNGDKKISLEPYVPLNATCIQCCTSSGNGTVVNRTLNEFEVSCADSKLGILLKSDPKRYRSLKCDAKKCDGWKWEGWNGENVVNDAKVIDRLDLTCEKYQTTCEVVPGEGFNYDANKNKLSCKGNKLHKIKFNSHFYSYFQCDEANGWAAKTYYYHKDDEILEEPDFTPTKARCVEHCLATGTGIKVKVDEDSVYSNVIVKCDNDNDEMFYGEHRVVRNRARCSLYHGWSNTDDYQQLPNADHSAPIEFECRSPTTTSTTITTPTPETTTTEAPPKNAGAHSQFGLYSAIGGIVLAIAVIA